ncbi:MAG: LON peptidase substrate-binding domain-containing protein [Planctomycetota bacterium]
MSHADEITALPEDFDNRVRLFPLPELVVFPHAMQPLHIFEPRYCDLLDESIKGDGLIAMATVRPQSIAGGHGFHGIEPTVCIGRVISHSEVEPNRHNILLIGIRRARLIREIDTNRSFRSAQVELIDDIYPVDGSSNRQRLKQRVLHAFDALIPNKSDVQKNLAELMASQMPLGPITDIIAFTMELGTENKLQLLAEGDVDRRATHMAEILEARYEQTHGKIQQLGSAAKDNVAKERVFPPPFSLN